jgi:starch synthase
MQVLFVSSEVVPWSKTGGLGDVGGALPRALADRGHDVTVVTPRYGTIDPRERGFAPEGRTLRIRGEPTGLWVRRGRPDVVLVENERFYGSRRGLYGDGAHDYPDNAERFAHLSRAALALPAALGLRPAIVHANDWQTGLAPYLLRHEHAGDPALAGARTVFTIHNLAYQGVFPKQVLPFLGLPWDVFRVDAMEFFDRVSFMKAGLSFADALTTVSPTYAREILTPDGGVGLDPVLRHRRQALHGILNGIDVGEWDPARDPHLPAHYSARDLGGKGACKASLQRELGLPVRPDVPLVAMVSRLVDQKGVDLVVGALGQLVTREVQLAVLGTGSPAYEEAFRRAAAAQPSQVAVRIVVARAARGGGAGRNGDVLAAGEVVEAEPVGRLGDAGDLVGTRVVGPGRVGGGMAREHRRDET